MLERNVILWIKLGWSHLSQQLMKHMITITTICTMYKYCPAAHIKINNNKMVKGTFGNVFNTPLFLTGIVCETCQRAMPASHNKYYGYKVIRGLIHMKSCI